MFSTNTVIICFLAFCIPYGSCLTCLFCTNVPGDFPQVSCSNPVNQTCGAGQDRCEIISMVANTGLGISNMTERNCTTSATCDERCKQINETKLQGKMSDCRIHCCKDDRCNDQFHATVAPTTSTNVSSTPATGPVTISGVCPTIQVVSGSMFLMMLVLENMLVNEVM